MTDETKQPPMNVVHIEFKDKASTDISHFYVAENIDALQLYGLASYLKFIADHMVQSTIQKHAIIEEESKILKPH